MQISFQNGKSASFALFLWGAGNNFFFLFFAFLVLQKKKKEIAYLTPVIHKDVE